jgi:RES domain-containing protein
MRAFRIADGRFPIFDGTGARLAGGRWNTPGRSVIYAVETFAGAMLEILVHTNLYRLPQNYSYVEVRVPETVGGERVSASDLPNWESADQAVTRSLGDRWLAEARSAVLIVPSVVTRGIEANVLLNPLHPDFCKIEASQPRPVHWDIRLFARKER